MLDHYRYIIYILNTILQTLMSAVKEVTCVTKSATTVLDRTPVAVIVVIDLTEMDLHAMVH